MYTPKLRDQWFYDGTDMITAFFSSQGPTVFIPDGCHLDTSSLRFVSQGSAHHLSVFLTQPIEVVFINLSVTFRARPARARTLSYS